MRMEANASPPLVELHHPTELVQTIQSRLSQLRELFPLLDIGMDIGIAGILEINERTSKGEDLVLILQALHIQRIFDPNRLSPLAERILSCKAQQENPDILEPVGPEPAFPPP